MEEAGLLQGTHPVLGHAGLKCPDLGVWSSHFRALLIHAALTLQLLELQVLI